MNQPQFANRLPSKARNLSCRKVGLTSISGRRGGAAVEFAVVAPFLLIVVQGVCEIGQALRVESVLSDAAHTACAAASQPGCSNSTVIGAAKIALSANGLPANSATVTVQVNDQPGDLATARRNDKITVTVAIPLAEATWTKSPFFLRAGSLQSSTITMLKQG